MTEKHTCDGEVYRRGNSWRNRFVRCGKTASLNEGGHWYCRVHAPSIVEDKKAKRHAEWELEWGAKRSAEARRIARERIAEAAINARTAEDGAAFWRLVDDYREEHEA